MAVERKTFIWKGNDRGVRAYQEQAGISWDNINHGATCVASWNRQFGQWWSITPSRFDNSTFNDFGRDGGTSSQGLLDVFWNNKDNWAEELPGGSMGSSKFYIRATRIPHRGDNVVFKHVRGTTANGLMRKEFGNTGPDDGITQSYDGEFVGGIEGFNLNGEKAFDLPLSPCLFGGYSQTTDGLSGEGAHWAGADTSGTSFSNRQGPLASVTVRPSYFAQQYCALEGSPVEGWQTPASLFDGDTSITQGFDALCLRYWGGRTVSSFGISGASFANVKWNVGGTGLNIRALDVTINAPFKMNNLADYLPAGSDGNSMIIYDANDFRYRFRDGYPFYGTTTFNPLEDAFGDINEDFTQARIGFCDNIINLSVGCNYFLSYGGRVTNLNFGDRFLCKAPDSHRKSFANTYGMPGNRVETWDDVEVDIYALNNTVSSLIRCDPTWWKGYTDFNVSAGNPDIHWGPYYSYGVFHPKVTAAGTINCYPQFMSAKRFNVDNAENFSSPENYHGLSGPVPSFGDSRLFGSFYLSGITGRFAATTIKQNEFNPRWDTVTSGGSTKNPAEYPRGFNNMVQVNSGCTITNLNIDGGYFRMGPNHEGGDTFDAPNEVGDVVITNGYAEDKAYLCGVHPTKPTFNAFYVGVNGVGTAGYNFQVRSPLAEYDFGAGVYLRSGPQTTGVTSGGFAFVQAPYFATKYNP